MCFSFRGDYGIENEGLLVHLNSILHEVKTRLRSISEMDMTLFLNALEFISSYIVDQTTDAHLESTVIFFNYVIKVLLNC